MTIKNKRFAYISEDFFKNNLELLMRLPSQYIDWCPPIEVAYMARRYTITQRLISQIASMTSPLDEELRLRFIAQMFPSAAHGCIQNRVRALKNIEWFYLPSLKNE